MRPFAEMGEPSSDLPSQDGTTRRRLFCPAVQSRGNVGWVVGLPIHCDGKESIKSEEARAFARWLEELTHLPARLVDERFSTALANQLLRPADLTRKQTKQRVDRVAALVILESFLERTKTDRQEEPDPLE